MWQQNQSLWVYLAYWFVYNHGTDYTRTDDGHTDVGMHRICGPYGGAAINMMMTMMTITTTSE